MDSAAWLSSLAAMLGIDSLTFSVCFRPEDAEQVAAVERHEEKDELQDELLDELLSMGFQLSEAQEALAASRGDLVEALAFLTQRLKKRRVAGAGVEQVEEQLEVEGIKCALHNEELVMWLVSE